MEGVWALRAELELESGSSGPRPAFPQLPAASPWDSCPLHGPESLSDYVLVPLVAPNSPLVKEAVPNSLVKIFLLTS